MTVPTGHTRKMINVQLYKSVCDQLESDLLTFNNSKFKIFKANSEAFRGDLKALVSILYAVHDTRQRLLVKWIMEKNKGAKARAKLCKIYLEAVRSEIEITKILCNQ